MKENLIDRGKHMCKRGEDKNQGGRQALFVYVAYTYMNQLKLISFLFFTQT